MSILKIARLGHPILRTQTRPLDVSEISEPTFQRLIDDMFDTMREYEGIGLAAPQVHQNMRLFIAGVDNPEMNFQPVIMINPKVTIVGSKTNEDWEGCLSIPDIRGRVQRATDITISALDRQGRAISMDASGFPARVIQHETDHLDGVLFFDRMTSFKTLTFLDEYSRYWDQEEEKS